MKMNTGRFFSPGKLLITAEYAVLDGALALALPTKLGQELFYEIIENTGTIIHWETYHQGKPWLSVTIDYQRWTILETNLPQAASFILKVLNNVQKASGNTRFLNADTYRLKTNLQFPSNYGLGSSSTLMANLAQWAEIDAFELNEKSLGGSGYDVAVAQKKCPILYRLQNAERCIYPIEFLPEFSDELLFVHLNQKQDSRAGIRLYKGRPKSEVLIQKFSDITEAVLNTKNVETFSSLMEEHEGLLSDFLKLPTVKSCCFPDIPVFVKSLGAWGGDFVMTRKFEGYKQYFLEKGFETVFEYQEMIDKEGYACSF